MMVYIFLLFRDVNKIKGLCGILINNCQDDFFKGDGIYYIDSNMVKSCFEFGLIDYRFQLDVFLEMWR